MRAALSNMRGVLVILVVLAAAACCRIPAVRALTPVTPWESGFATYVKLIFIAQAWCTCMVASAARAPWSNLFTNIDAIVLQVLWCVGFWQVYLAMVTVTLLIVLRVLNSAVLHLSS